MLDALTQEPMTTAEFALLQKYTIPFMFCFGLTMYFCIIGDDDVVYRFMDRRPTGEEAIARIRFVLAKLFASLCGGALMSAFGARYVLKNVFSLTVSQDDAVLFGVACIFITSMLIGVVQNIIRRIQGRQQRPLIDMVIWRHNLRQRWFPRR